MPQDLYVELFDCSEIWQLSWQKWCRGGRVSVKFQTTSVPASNFKGSSDKALDVYQILKLSLSVEALHKSCPRSGPCLHRCFLGC